MTNDTKATDVKKSMHLAYGPDSSQTWLIKTISSDNWMTFTKYYLSTLLYGTLAGNRGGCIFPPFIPRAILNCFQLSERTPQNECCSKSKRERVKKNSSRSEEGDNDFLRVYREIDGKKRKFRQAKEMVGNKCLKLYRSSQLSFKAATGNNFPALLTMKLFKFPLKFAKLTLWCFWTNSKRSSLRFNCLNNTFFTFTAFMNMSFTFLHFHCLESIT